MIIKHTEENHTSGRGREKILGVRRNGEHQETWPSESTEQESYGLTKTEVANTRPTRV